MAIRNGSQTDTEYQVQHPVPLQGGYLASTAMTVTSIALVVAGAAGEIYTLVVQAGTTIEILAILAVLTGAAVEGYNLYLGSSRVTGSIEGVTVESVMVFEALTPRTFLSHEEGRNVAAWPFSPNSDHRVVFFDVGGPTEQAASKLTIANDSEVVLVQKKGFVAGSPFAVEVTP